ncbi:50S ribosomal protein L7/L12 [Orientia tsutsugamushi]|uniref:Large ribosomal subunit protein bL12 n=3 Tax=Orientia tsutsugamushi TaxID=784 RepID=A0A0F3MBX6_ORITS|nr:50S ribosomal protein L7/L12 [Orientia tsutsugamushi]KJV75850.1 ribosomal protein L7/L12 [Orientia tsutsugamushi str. TA763]KJV91106.1 ribosomal protein L7/L12 [Orientia tsutsugamushi str. UT76]KJV53141.1 ribosomal protein L7/L12 [Orientia tsutsugamushi str. Gilliam]KJV57634.1 ribosomal protein L7/L12 [Orientia tsutsugamushi str. Karp]KJV77387.1 ribosomal protein L7/L12 [Orientia tsutsugamushi str. TA716]
MSKTMSENVKKAVDMLSTFSVIELLELTKVLEEEWGVSSIPSNIPVATAMAPVQESEEEKNEFDVILATVPEKKVDVIKIVKNITGLALKEAKEMVDSAPKVIKASISKAEAEDIKSQLENVGAKVELK